MPANLSPEYYEAEERYRSAKSVEEKVAALEDMLRLIPKHKGTDKLQGEIKARLAKLRRQPQKKGTKGFSRHIPKQGAGQVLLVGPPNGGKSTLVAELTHANPEVAPYPFTTRDATPAMMPFKDIAFQLIDLPPLSEEHVEPWVYDLIRVCDLVWLVVDSASSLDGIELSRRLLSAKHLELFPADKDPPDEQPVGMAFKPALLVVTGADRPGSAENLQILEGLLGERWPTLLVAAAEGLGLDELKRSTFETLRIMRVYTKQPGKPAQQDQPFTLPVGSTVAELARTIHKDIQTQFKFARIWGPSAFDGQTVQGEHVLQEGDLVEIHL